jgi:hypothetical protein
LYAFVISPMHATCPVHFIPLDLTALIIFSEACKLMKLLIMQSSAPSHHFLPPGSKYSPQHPVFIHPRCMFFP